MSIPMDDNNIKPSPIETWVGFPHPSIDPSIYLIHPSCMDVSRWRSPRHLCRLDQSQISHPRHELSPLKRRYEQPPAKHLQPFSCHVPYFDPLEGRQSVGGRRPRASHELQLPLLPCPLPFAFVSGVCYAVLLIRLYLPRYVTMSPVHVTLAHQPLSCTSCTFQSWSLDRAVYGRHRLHLCPNLHSQIVWVSQA